MRAWIIPPSVHSSSVDQHATSMLGSEAVLDFTLMRHFYNITQMEAILSLTFVDLKYDSLQMVSNTDAMAAQRVCRHWLVHSKTVIWILHTKIGGILTVLLFDMYLLCTVNIAWNVCDQAQWYKFSNILILHWMQSNIFWEGSYISTWYFHRCGWVSAWRLFTQLQSESSWFLCVFLSRRFLPLCWCKNLFW